MAIPMNFVAVDVETANSDISSICQFGIARYRNSLLECEWESHVNPETYFDFINTSIHGIDETTVEGAPTLPEIADLIARFLKDQTVLCHTHFDRVAVQRAFDAYDIAPPQCTWLDTARVARRAWKEFASDGYGLGSVCAALGYQFDHHDALEDAKAAAHVFLEAASRTGLDMEGWLKRVEQPIDPSPGRSNSKKITKEGNPDGPLFGEITVFTGALEIPRREAVEMAALVGCQVVASVTRKTTMLVVGDQNVGRLAGHTKSSKHRKAEELILGGQQIRVVRESDFKEIVALANVEDSQ